MGVRVISGEDDGGSVELVYIYRSSPTSSSGNDFVDKRVNGC